MLRAFLHDRPKAGFALSARTVMSVSMIRKSGYRFFRADHAQTQRSAAIRPLGATGKVPVTSERMDAIRNTKTMAGSPDADLFRSASRNLAHGFCVFGAP